MTVGITQRSQVADDLLVGELVSDDLLVDAVLLPARDERGAIVDHVGDIERLITERNPGDVLIVNLVIGSKSGIENGVRIIERFESDDIMWTVDLCQMRARPALFDPTAGLALIDAGLVDDPDTAAILYDLDVLDRQISRVTTSFPATAHHAVAVKSNPLVCVLREVAARGLFAEAASAEELALARVAGFDGRTVWDSPAKTSVEIAAAMTDTPWLVNVDSFAEFDRGTGRRDKQSTADHGPHRHHRHRRWTPLHRQR